MLNRCGTKTDLAATLIAASSGLAAQTATLKTKVTNNRSAGGLSITPLYTALHNGPFDAFDNMGTASAGFELIAETADQSAIAAERLAVGLFLPAPCGPPPV